MNTYCEAAITTLNYNSYYKISCNLTLTRFYIYNIVYMYVSLFRHRCRQTLSSGVEKRDSLYVNIQYTS